MQKQSSDIGRAMDVVESVTTFVLEYLKRKNGVSTTTEVEPAAEAGVQPQHRLDARRYQAAPTDNTTTQRCDLMRTYDDESDALEAGELEVSEEQAAVAASTATTNAGAALTGMQLAMQEYKQHTEHAGDGVIEQLRGLKRLLQTEQADARLLTQMRALRASLGAQKKKLQESIKSNQEQASELRKQVKTDQVLALLMRAKVVCATLSGSAQDMLKAYRARCAFETVIIDEAAQAVEPSTLVPLQSVGLRCVLFGDTNQLAPTVLGRRAANAQYTRSLFERLQLADVAPILLDTQYRMHPLIRRFPSRAFYDNRLKDGANIVAPSNGTVLRAYRRSFHVDPLFGVCRFYDLPHALETRRSGGSTSLRNVDEARFVCQLYDTLLNDYAYVRHMSILVLTPYSAQVRQLVSALGTRLQQHRGQVSVRSIDSAQGGECDIVFFSCVRASARGGVGFVGDVRRLNVAITRARLGLFVVGHRHTLQAHPVWNAFFQDLESVTVISNIIIFFLYLKKKLFFIHSFRDNQVQY